MSLSVLGKELGPYCHDPTQPAMDHPMRPAPSERPTPNPDTRRLFQTDIWQFRVQFVIPPNATYLAVIRPMLGSLGKWVESV